MKKRLAPKILTALVVVALIVFAAPVLRAGDYHFGTTLICAECHVMHYSQSHTYQPDGSGSFTALGAGGPFVKLLRNEVNSLCLTCHNGSSSPPDVLETQTGGVIRQAGALNRNNILPYTDITGHTLDSTDVAMGGTWNNPDGFDCADCHEPHGDDAGAVGVAGGSVTNPYRNLRTNAGNAGIGTVNVSYTVTTVDPTKDVYEAAALNYSVSAVDFYEPADALSPARSAMAEWCKKCHTNFHGDKGDPETVGGATGVAWLRHPSSGADIGDAGGRNSSLSLFQSRINKVKVMDPDGDWAGTLDGDETPFCLSCHKAHGNRNAFGLIYMSGTGTISEEGDGGSEVRQLCQQCHVQGD